MSYFNKALAESLESFDDKDDFGRPFGCLDLIPALEHCCNNLLGSDISEQEVLTHLGQYIDAGWVVEPACGTRFFIRSEAVPSFLGQLWFGKLDSWPREYAYNSIKPSWHSEWTRKELLGEALESFDDNDTFMSQADIEAFKFYKLLKQFVKQLNSSSFTPDLLTSMREGDDTAADVVQGLWNTIYGNTAYVEDDAHSRYSPRFAADLFFITGDGCNKKEEIRFIDGQWAWDGPGDESELGQQLEESLESFDDKDGFDDHTEFWYSLRRLCDALNSTKCVPETLQDRRKISRLVGLRWLLGNYVVAGDGQDIYTSCDIPDCIGHLYYLPGGIWFNHWHSCSTNRRSLPTEVANTL